MFKLNAESKFANFNVNGLVYFDVFNIIHLRIVYVSEIIQIKTL